MSASGSPLDAVTEVLAGYKPGFAFVDEAHVNTVEQFTVIPARGTPRLLLPTHGAAMATALKSFLGGHRWAAFAPSALRLLSKVGGTAVLSRDVALVSDSASEAPVRELISSVLGRSDFELAFRLSVGRPNAKTVAIAITPDGEPLCFAKFGSEAMTNALVQYEGQVLENFQNRDLPVLMPRVLHADIWAGNHHVLITAPLKMEPLKRQAMAAHRAADLFTMASPITTSTLLESEYWQNTKLRVSQVDPDMRHRPVLLRAVEFVERTWGSVELDFGYSHGDWSRPNLGTVGGQIIALDWERCTSIAPRGIDTAHFAVIEQSSSSAGRPLDLEAIANRARHYLDEIGRSPIPARPLITLDFIEMVLRFTSARAAGIPATDVHFGPALQAAIMQWGR